VRKKRSVWALVVEGWRAAQRSAKVIALGMSSALALSAQMLVAVRLWDLKTIARRGLAGEYVSFPEVLPLLYCLSTGSSWRLLPVPGSDPRKTKVWDPNVRQFGPLTREGVPLRHEGSVVVANALTGERLLLVASDTIEGGQLLALLSTLPDSPDRLEMELTRISGFVSATGYGERG
jgi:hypothetical protein